MEEEEEQITIWKSSSSSTSSSQPDSMVSATVGRVMATLLSARPKKLHDAISRLDSLWILDKYIRDAAVKEESLDHVLVPMIEHSVKHKGVKNSKQAMILLSWLFQDELLFQAVTRDLASIMLRKDDHYIALGWCLLARGLVEMETTMSGMREKYNELLKILCSCIGHLLYIIRSGRGGVGSEDSWSSEETSFVTARFGKQFTGGFELPTRLSVAAADCVLSLTIALTRQDTDSEILDNRMKSSNPPAPNRPVTLVPAFVNEKKVNWTRISSELSSNKDIRFLLWDLLDELITIVQRLIAWSRKSRSLHGKGLEKVVKWLQEIKQRYGRFQDEAGSQMVRTGLLLLSSCWKHYGVLLHLEDYRLSQRYEEMLEQYLSGIQVSSENNADEQAENRESKMETLKFFLNCLLLLLGRLDGKQFENAMSEKGLQIARVLTTQLSSADEDVIEGAACIFKAAMFRASSSLSDTRHMDAALPLLLHLLDERDGASKAVVILVAEYCSISSDSQCLEEVLKRLATGNVLQRRNAIDVISEYICISIDSVAALTHSTWKDIANHLLERLGDEELEIRLQASNLIPMIDPSLVLPTVVRLIYSSEERVHLSASSTLIAVLKYHNQNCDVICMLLDCLSNLSQNPDLPNIARDGKEGMCRVQICVQASDSSNISSVKAQGYNVVYHLIYFPKQMK
ncbi:hypothetical protein RJ640_010751 [Escallonia rubra]|uniref:ARM repeat superfamily protein n=1 Tax=Escallonia rubra TaxID=112253 RepID=A0AA88URP7_9ASTE|nr:hypothetical protein RJ640_010751 [Escallonia rubra]